MAPDHNPIILDQIESARPISESDQEFQELKNTFIALVSHELRTPLNLLAGYLDLTLEEIDQDPKRAKEYLSMVGENTRKMMTIVQELTDFARMQYDNKISYLAPVSIAGAFLQTYDLLKPNLQKKNINLIVDFQDSIRELKFDGESLIILFRNLLSNAAKFSDTDGKVSVIGKQIEGLVSISVNDWAKPIPENKSEDIFEDFRQLENHLTRRYEGMGLGLAVARRTARFLGGDLKLLVRNDGNTFEILLPLEKGI